MLSFSRILGKFKRSARGARFDKDPVISDFVFICGLHRSGTTLLENLMVSRFEISCLRGDVPENEGQHLQSLYSPASRFGVPGRFALNEEMQAELHRLDDYVSCRKLIWQDWCRHVVGTSPVLVEKSPPNLTKIWWLRRVFPNCRFVIVSRDPRAVSAATQKWTNATLAEMMKNWDVAYSACLKDFDESDCIIIRYEDLAADPDREMQRIATFLGLTGRAKSLEIAGRFNGISNTNDKYLAAHGNADYGNGAWRRFGYDF